MSTLFPNSDHTLLVLSFSKITTNTTGATAAVLSAHLVAVVREVEYSEFHYDP
jgi:hypothetical protein